ncbi:DUF1768 domain-containing protein [Mycena sanguinolenta]|uniref:DUF1768 domain-containing protein n=1 Tax=Mycena sanguinolenta TaxID=230812 RepID=A0A8H7CV97_9AGAR|nr:DUF1768 domain-containing protein [Mycena sanguinolenta]
MPSPLQTVLDVILGITPVPGLSAAFTLLKTIVSAIQQVSKSKQQLALLAQSAAQLLQMLNAEFSASRLMQSTCAKPLRDLHGLLLDIQAFVREEQARPFLKALLAHDSRMEGIDAFHRRMDTLADAFQISALIHIQHTLSNGERPPNQDNGAVNARLADLEQKQMQLWRRLDTSHPVQPFTHSAASTRMWAPLLIAGQTSGAQYYWDPPHDHHGLWTCVSHPCVWGLMNLPIPQSNMTDLGLMCPWGCVLHSSVDGSVDPKRTAKREQILFNPHTKDQYQCFSTFSPHSIVYNNKEYPTAEHLFQAFKFMDNRPDIAEAIRTSSRSASKAFKCSRAYLAHQHPDWEMMRTSKMEIAMWHKFSQDMELKRKLLATEDAELVHYTINDFWGVGEDKKGRNELGKALERVRASFR